MTASILILGYGNPSRGDDALGPLLLDRLDERLGEEIRQRVGGIETLTDFQLQVEHALDLVERKLVLFVDADVACPPPYRFERLSEAEDPFYCTHALNPTAVLSVYRQITGQPAPDCFLLGIRGERFELGESLSPSAKTHLEAAVQLAVDLCAHPLTAYWQSQSTSPS